MSIIRFTKKLGTVKYGTVEVGDEVDVSAADAKRYIANGLAEAVAPVKPRGRPTRNGKEG